MLNDKDREWLFGYAGREMLQYPLTRGWWIFRRVVGWRQVRFGPWPGQPDRIACRWLDTDVRTGESSLGAAH